MKLNLCALVLVIILMLNLCACETVTKSKEEIFALDTVISFEMQTDQKNSDISDAKELISNYETMFSATKEKSDIYKVNHADGGEVRVSDETAQLIRTSLEISQLTDGAFDISVYELVKLWGFDTKDYRVPTDEEIKQTLAKSGFENISITDDNIVSINNGATIDFGGIAKGYIAENTRECILKDNANDFSAVINFGGMVTTIGENNSREDGSWVIGVEYPDTNGSYFATFKGNAATTSGSTQRYFEQDSKRYHHIIDPKTGKPAESDMSSVTITNECCAYSDAMSTAFFVMGIDKTISFIKEHKHPDGSPYSVIILSNDKKHVYITDDLLDKSFELLSEYKNSMELHVIET